MWINEQLYLVDVLGEHSRGQTVLSGIASSEDSINVSERMRDGVSVVQLQTSGYFFVCVEDA